MGRTAVILALVASLLVATTGCTRQVTGTAQPDPNKPPVVIVEDGFGIKIGFADAPVQLELYTEPQCNHCADLQADFGEQLRQYIAMGQLAVTYRPLTFLDTGANQHSDRVANAMFDAATSGGGEEHVTTTDAIAFQRFVEAAWAQYAEGANHPTTDELAEMARTAGIPDDIAARIGSGDPAVGTKAMQDTNFEFLYQIDSVDTGTPTAYDMNKDEKLDIYDDDWLSKVMGS
jgi:protein-disulfide isomerase